jgi:uncharacterized protein
VRTAALWTGEQILRATSDEPPWDWLRTAYHTFSSTLLNEAPKFPCSFGASAEAHGHNSFTVLDSRLPRAYGTEALAENLVTFRDRAWTGPRRQSFVVFLGPPEEGVDLSHDRDRFWRLLLDLHALDRAPWPDDFTRDPKDPKWEWCFAGEPWFTFMCSPAYVARRSRNIGSCLTIVFQTRRIFDGLAGNSPPGQIAKQTVRGRLAAYEELPPHPHLGSTEKQCDHKWRQYFLPDDLTTFPVDSCPF